MTADSYQTIFELGFRSFPWPRIIQPLSFLILGLLVIRFFRNKNFYLIVGMFVTSMALLFFLLSLLFFVPDFVTLRSAYVSGKSVVVEGVVQDFRPAPTIGSARESFSVNGTSFSYYAGDGTPCFNNAPLHRGPIREGLDVRIHYYEGCIQRVDVLREAAHQPSNSQP